MSLLIDTLATASVLGIWPRFIEPRLVKVTELDWKLSPHAAHLDGLRVVQLSDLHFHPKVPKKFLDKVSRKVNLCKPDLILFTGDFICYANLEQEKRLHAFLTSLEAKLGAFCIFGNHDYARYVSRNAQGVYDLVSQPNPLVGVMRGVRALFGPQTKGYTLAQSVRKIGLHTSLCDLLKNTPFQLLENTTTTLPLGLNLTGLGDLALGRCDPEKAYKGYDKNFPGITLSHNPDSFPDLLDYPGDWILAGHTHGEQIHLPWPKIGRRLTRKLARLDHPEYTRGLFQIGDKQLYVNRGLGCHKPFRLCSPPEITLITAKRMK